MISIPGSYNVCLDVEDVFGCVDTSCQQLIIIPAEIENLNVITPNNDNSNDVLYFDYLDSFNESEIFIYNRWGNLVYQASPYLNNWSGDNLTDGVYFYLLKIKDNDKTYSSFFQLLR
jgi:gliding motility-associated-like protein